MNLQEPYSPAVEKAVWREVDWILHCSLWKIVFQV